MNAQQAIKINSSVPWQLACFDLDGTLARPISTGHHLAKKLGHGDLMSEIELLYEQGKASNADVAAIDGKYYAGYSPAEIEELLFDIPLIGEIQATVDYLADKGIPCVICTLAWDFVAQAIAQRFGFVAWSGPSLVINNMGRFTGAVRANFEETDKVAFVQAFCERSGINIQNVFHVGDSRADIPLFKVAGFSVALNGNEAARSNASVALNSDSLLDVLNAIPDF